MCNYNRNARSLNKLIALDLPCVATDIIKKQSDTELEMIKYELADMVGAQAELEEMISDEINERLDRADFHELARNEPIDFGIA